MLKNLREFAGRCSGVKKTCENKQYNWEIIVCIRVHAGQRDWWNT